MLYLSLVVVIEDATLQDLHPLSLIGKKHIVRQGTGGRGHHLSVSDIVDHLTQGYLFRIEQGVAVFLEEIVQGLKAKFKGTALGKLGAAVVDFGEELGRASCRERV